MAYRRGGWSQDPFFRKLDMAERGFDAEEEFRKAPDVPLKPGEAEMITAKVINQENKDLRARVKELEAENKILQEAYDTVEEVGLRTNGEKLKRIATLEKALRGLVIRLIEIDKHPKFKAVWVFLEIHNLKYQGPTWVDALEIAKKALEETPPKE